jgi:chromate transporter
VSRGGSIDRTRVSVRAPSPDGNWREVFAAFLKLGLTSFGGPIAHIGYFRREIVERRQWLSESAFADLVGLCQFLPGPASSQTGFALGMMRAGPFGGLAAWTAFALPSAVLLLLFGYAANALTGPVGLSAIHGLKLVAVAIVAQAVIGMARTLTPDLPRAAIALGVAALVLVSAIPFFQVMGILLGGVAGLLVCRPPASHAQRPVGWIPGRRTGTICLAVFAVLLVTALVLAPAASNPLEALAAIFYRAGALVFGGGHVVLPLLRASMVPQWIDDPTFLAGYGAAQAVPGPLFTFAAFTGFRVAGLVGAVIALVFIFLPGLLLVSGLLPIQESIRGNVVAQRALAGVNAAVVGILAAALYDPLWTTGVQSMADIFIVLVGLLLLLRWNVPPLVIVALTVFASISIAHLRSSILFP